MQHPTKTQRATRARALTLHSKTCAWVVPAEISRLIGAGELDKARARLTAARKVWGDDPEIIRAESLIAFLTP